MAKIQKELSIVLLVAFVAVIAVLIMFLNSANLTALQYTNSDNFVGQALSAITGKVTCGTAQKSICQQQQTRCATMKGTWTGNCSTCTIKCTLPKK